MDTTININSADYYARLAEGLIPGHSLVQKFGAGTLTDTMKPVTNSGFYRTPKALTSLEVVSTSDEDGVGGTGLRKITVEGVNFLGQKVSADFDTDGTTAAALGDWFRVHRWFGIESGTYADQNNGSQAGTMTIQEAGGGDVWSILPMAPFPTSQSQIGVYTVPVGFTAYLLSKNIVVDSSKTADIYFFKRGNITKVTAPYEPMRLVEREVGVSGGLPIIFKPKLLGAGPMDVGFMGVMSQGVAECSVEFEISLVEDE